MSENTDHAMAEVIQRIQRSSRRPPQWSTPSEGTWDAIASHLGFEASAGSGPEPALAPGESPREATPRGGVNRRSLFTGLGGLVVGLALGAGGLKIAQDAIQSHEVAVKRAVLTPLERQDEELGVAELRPEDVGYSLVVEVPEGASHLGGYVEVWLINVDGARMVSVGVFAAGTTARFHVSDALIEAGYLIVDLSNEEFDDEPRHSGDTIMRGELRA